jgi:TP901 family phage tail tape measure protein
MSAALAILGNNSIKGGEAGTALKSMMLPIVSGADGAAKALAKVGLKLSDFRDDAQNMLPIGQAMDIVKQAISGLGKEAQDAALLDIFGSYGMKAAIVLMNEGEAGFKKMEATMAGASSVGTKFGDIMSGLSGAGSKVMAAIERLAIAVSNALAPSLTEAAASIADVIEQATEWVKANQGAVLIAAKLAAGAAAIGGAMIALGTAMMIGSTAVGLFLKPLGLISGVGLGATGAMITGTMVDELERRGAKRALITLCIGGGMGVATIIERV